MKTTQRNRTLAAALLAMTIGLGGAMTSRAQTAGAVEHLDTQALTVAANAGVDLDKLSEKAVKSLVSVEYTFRNENSSQEEVGQGIVLTKSGVVIISGGMLPEGFPKEWIKDLKIRLPNKHFTTVPATFLGRTVSRLFAYVKADEAIDVPPLDISHTMATSLGQKVVAVAMYSKNGGFETYVGFGRVRAVLHLAHTMALVQSFALTRATSPVFDEGTGALVGLTFPPVPETFTMNTDSGAGHVLLKDDEMSALYLPMDEVQDALTNVPEKPYVSRRPWMGVDGLTGVEEQVRALDHIDQPAAVAIGSVVPDMPADKAGLKSGDIVLTIDDKPFSDNPVPEYMVSHLQRVLEKVEVGQTVTFGVWRDGARLKIPVKMSASPVIASEMPHIFNTKVGITSRDIVFGDTYARKLPADTKGVIVALVKKGAPASVGQTPLQSGYLITRVNDQEVQDQKQFEDLLKGATDAGDNGDKKEIVFRVLRPDGETQVCRIDLTK